MKNSDISPKLELVLLVVIFVTIAVSAVSIRNMNIDGNGNSFESNDVQNVSGTDFEIFIGSGDSCDLKEIISHGFSGSLSKIEWNTSDSSVASVDKDGILTASGKGNVSVTAAVKGNVIMRINVECCGIMSEAVADTIKDFAVVGDVSSRENMKELLLKLEKCPNDVKGHIELLNSINAFSEAAFDSSVETNQLWKNLKKAAESTDTKLSQNILRRAALTAYCMGETENSDITISFTGDCTFGYFNETDKENMFPSVYKNSGSVSYPFDLVKNVFSNDDITMVNYEGTITTLTEHKDKLFYFRGEPQYTDILTSSSVEAVTLENNHAFDYFDAGFKEMALCMARAGIRYTCFSSPSVIQKNDCKVVMLSVSLVSTTYRPEFQNQIERYIKKYKGNDTVIVVNVHWGTEGAEMPDEWQTEAAHSMVDAGADLIIGHHPHRLQGMELYNGHYIVYSLGNFSFGGNSKATFKDTEILRFSFVKDSGGKMKLKGFSAVPCLTTSSGSDVNNFQPTPLWGSEAERNIKYFRSLSQMLEGGVKKIPSIGI